MDTMRPKISVCIPTYNRATYLRAALNSVFEQSMQDFEVIVYDDASFDDTVDVIKDFPDQRLRYFRQSHNVGIAQNRNSCLSEVRGDYIAWLDSDDLYLPEMLSRQAAVLDKHPNVGLVHGAFHVIDGEGKPLPSWPRPFEKDTIEESVDAFRELALCNYINSSTVMVRRGAYDSAGRYSVELANFCEDLEMWLRIGLHYDIAFTARPVAACRWHNDRATTTASRQQSCTRFERLVVHRVFFDHSAEIANRRRLKRRADAAIAARGLLRSGDASLRGRRKASVIEVVQAVRAAPWLLEIPRTWQMIWAISTRREMQVYLHSRALLKQLYKELKESRYGAYIGAQIDRDPDWDNQLQQIANIIRSHIPSESPIAVVDKWDPTLLALSRRSGWHFPDLELSPSGYPANSNEAISHLQKLIDRGAEYLIFPNAYRWWLEFYSDFHDHLENAHRRVFSDAICTIYELVTSRNNSHPVSNSTTKMSVPGSKRSKMTCQQ